MARRKAEGHEHHHAGMDYYVGRYAPKNGLGKIIISVNDAEKVSSILH